MKTPEQYREMNPRDRAYYVASELKRLGRTVDRAGADELVEERGYERHKWED